MKNSIIHILYEKNGKYFVDLPFKLNEDINLTKVTHPGMTPSDLQAVRKECHDLLRQGLVEPTQSNWTCQAFYVEKRAEKLRGTLISKLLSYCHATCIQYNTSHDIT